MRRLMGLFVLITFILGFTQAGWAGTITFDYSDASDTILEDVTAGNVVGVFISTYDGGPTSYSIVDINGDPAVDSNFEIIDLVGETKYLRTKGGVSLNYEGSTTYPIYIDDADPGDTHKLITLDVGDINEEPVAASATETATEDTNLIITLPGQITDPESDAQTITVTSLALGGAGALYQVAGDDTTPGAQITGTDTVVTNANGNVAFVPTANTSGSSLGSFNFKSNDGEFDSNAATITIDITAVNDTPALTLPGGTFTYTEGDAATLVDSGALADDDDDTDFNTGTLTVEYTANGAVNDVLEI
ncbi:MAG: hypothetical protein QGH40_16230, partial [bacterium]|nr:hypothetical protein [bacterium]